MQPRGESEDGVDDRPSVPEAWLTAAVREAVGEVPRRLLTEVANWPAPGGVPRDDDGGVVGAAGATGVAHPTERTRGTGG